MKMLIFAALTVLLCAYQGTAADHKILMLNKGEKSAMVFQPDFVRAEIGDTVTFVPTSRGHDAASIQGMMPEGIEPFKGRINPEVTITIQKEGIYGVKCTPHYAMGMVAMVVAGEPANLDQAKSVKHPGKAKKVFGELFALAEGR